MYLSSACFPGSLWPCLDWTASEGRDWAPDTESTCLIELGAPIANWPAYSYVILWPCPLLFKDPSHFTGVFVGWLVGFYFSMTRSCSLPFSLPHTVLLPQPSECWDYRPASAFPATPRGLKELSCELWAAAASASSWVNYSLSPPQPQSLTHHQLDSRRLLQLCE